TLINVVRGGEPLVIFPEGRLTVTGSLMKVYDGAGLIADKSDAMVVPVRIAGLEFTPFTRLKRHQVRRRWFPKVVVTVLEPVKLRRRAEAGKAIGVMLPNANGAAVTVIGLMSAGRVPAMINFTAGASNILAACKAAELSAIVTSRGFIEKAKLGALVAQLEKQ